MIVALGFLRISYSYLRNGSNDANICSLDTTLLDDTIKFFFSSRILWGLSNDLSRYIKQITTIMRLFFNEFIYFFIYEYDLIFSLHKLMHLFFYARGKANVNEVDHLSKYFCYLYYCYLSAFLLQVRQEIIITYICYIYMFLLS